MVELPQLMATIALILTAIGSGGLLIHRHLFFMLLSLNYLFMGMVLLLGDFSALNSDSSGQWYGLLVLLITTISLALLASALAIYFREHRSLDMTAPGAAREEI